ncbi:MAG: primosomal protein N' [Candidatus Omnitrophica bacterium]|nr:primosomal protein N' [Candidatus Omnitrophota bacterium]
MPLQYAQVILGLPVEGPFDYSVEEPLAEKLCPGCRVLVPFGRKQEVGVVVRVSSEAQWDTVRPITALLDEYPAVAAEALELTRRISRHCGSSWGEAVMTYLPAYLRKSKITALKPPLSSPLIDRPPRFFLFLRRAGCSGEEIRAKVDLAVQEGRSIIILTPEANRLAALARFWRAIYPGETLVYGRGTMKQEFEQWARIRELPACLVIGLRSAVFAPVNRLGLIVVSDEENEAYQQEQSPHYHGGTVAGWRAQAQSADLIVSGVLPRVETWAAAQQGLGTVEIAPPSRAPEIQIIDLTNYQQGTWFHLSAPLQEQIRRWIAAGKKILLILNRRGFSASTRCRSCGFVFQCPRCDVPMMSVSGQGDLVCGRCGQSQPTANVCPSCQSTDFKPTGIGIERMRESAAKMFPAAKIVLCDKDTKTLAAGDLIIATQAVLKFIPELTVDLAAVIDFDAEVNRFDFRSGFRALDLLFHLRQAAAEKLLIQTALPDNPYLRAFVRDDLPALYAQELALRRESLLPPWRALVAISLRGPLESAVLEQGKILQEAFQAESGGTFTVSELYQDSVPKIRDKYHYRISLTGQSAEAMLPQIKVILKNAKRKRGVIVAILVD